MEQEEKPKISKIYLLVIMAWAMGMGSMLVAKVLSESIGDGLAMGLFGTAILFGSLYVTVLVTRADIKEQAGGTETVSPPEADPA